MEQKKVVILRLPEKTMNCKRFYEASMIILCTNICLTGHDSQNNLYFDAKWYLILVLYECDAKLSIREYVNY